jgi:hypothetical protein
MDLGSAFAAAVMRQPRQEAFVEGNMSHLKAPRSW